MDKKKIIIYQVLPRLFGNDHAEWKKNGSISENGCGKFSAFTDKALQEIKNMGITHIWYTGVLEHATKTDYSAIGIKRDHTSIVKGNAGSPYAVKDYYDLDPDLADDAELRMKEFEALVERTHRAGLKVILDFVPNHLAREYHSDACPSGTEDFGTGDDQTQAFRPSNNYYYLPGEIFSPSFSLRDEDGSLYSEYPAKATGNDFFHSSPTVNDWYETVKLNYGVDYQNGRKKQFSPIPDTWQKMRDILLFWASERVDAFRCDMAEMVPVEFWAWAVPQIKNLFPQIIFIAEVYNPGEYRNYLQQGKFDYLYDKVGLYDTLRGVVCGYRPASDISSCWQSLDDIKDHMLYFMENHDEQRIASSFFASDPEKAVPAVAGEILMGNNPFMIYFGQELGERGMEEEGYSGLDGRTTIYDYCSLETIRDWRDKGSFSGGKLSAAQKELKKKYSFLMKVSNREKALSEGLFFDLMYVNPFGSYFDPSRQFAFTRYYEGEMILVALNFSDRASDLKIKIPAHMFEYYHLQKESFDEAEDLFSGEKANAEILPERYYALFLPPDCFRIIKFSRKQ